MTKLSKRLKICYFSMLALCVIAAVLGAIAICISYDGSKGYFDSSAASGAFKAVVAVASLAAFAPLFVFPKDELSGASPATTPVLFPSAYLAVAFLATSVIAFLSLCRIDLGIFTVYINSFDSSLPMLLLIAAVALLSLAAAAYFVLNFFAADREQKRNEYHALVGFALLLELVALIALSYFDTTVSMNATGKLMFSYSMIAFMLFILSELRGLLDISKPRLYLVFGFLTMITSCASSIPWLVGLVAGTVAGPLYPTYLLYNLISLGAFAYSSVRIYVFVSARDLAEHMDQYASSEYVSLDNAPEDEETEAPDKEGDRDD